jgi:hypothetical protein
VHYIAKVEVQLDHWYLDATVSKDRVEEVYYVSDPARNVRRLHGTTGHPKDFAVKFFKVPRKTSSSFARL